MHEKCFGPGTCVRAGNSRDRMFTLGVEGESRKASHCRRDVHRTVGPVLVQGTKERDTTVLPSPMALSVVSETVSLSIQTGLGLAV